MDRRSWLWRRKSLEKSPGETESSGSASSHSERFSDDQDTLRASSYNGSPNHAQSPEVSSIPSNESCDTIKSLSEKLGAALAKIKAKEELVKQHSKVAEEAVTGWERAESELSALKQQLESATHTNSALEDRISDLDGACKECVRQLHQLREEEEQNIHKAIAKKMQDWESEKFRLDSQIVELKIELEATKSLIDHDLRSKFEDLEKQNSSLKDELDLSIRAAENASKHHLESIKKVTKLESECLRLRAAVRKYSSTNDHNKPIQTMTYVESVTDSQSDNDHSCSDSWASALIAELDQFKSEKAASNLALETDLMDDFLEMERLAAMPETTNNVDDVLTKNKDDHELVVELEKEIEKMKHEKTELELNLVSIQNELDNSSKQLAELQRQLDFANRSKHAIEMEVGLADAKRKLLESQLESSRSEVRDLCEKVSFLEEKLSRASTMEVSTDGQDLHVKVVLLEKKLHEATALSAEYTAKYHDFETIEKRKTELESQHEKNQNEIKELQQKVVALQTELEQERALSEELASNATASEAQKKLVEAQLESAYADFRKLQENVVLLEKKVESTETEKMTVELQLKSAHFEVDKLHEKVGLIESKVEEESARSASSADRLEAAEAYNMALESLLKSARTEIENLNEKLALLEKNLVEEKSLCAESRSNLAALEIKNKELDSEIQSARLEITKLQEELVVTKREFEEARKLAADVNAYREMLEKMKLNGGIATTNGKIDSKQSNVLGEQKFKQDKEVHVAAGKLVECQKTMASLSQQLKSLKSIDDFIFEAEHNDVVPGIQAEDLSELSVLPHRSSSSSSIGNYVARLSPVGSATSHVEQ